MNTWTLLNGGAIDGSRQCRQYRHHRQYSEHRQHRQHCTENAGNTKMSTLLSAQATKPLYSEDITDRLNIRVHGICFFVKLTLSIDCCAKWFRTLKFGSDQAWYNSAFWRERYLRKEHWVPPGQWWLQVWSIYQKPISAQSLAFGRGTFSPNG